MPEGASILTVGDGLKSSRLLHDYGLVNSLVFDPGQCVGIYAAILKTGFTGVFDGLWP
jgi:hypothetical protein